MFYFNKQFSKTIVNDFVSAVEDPNRQTIKNTKFGSKNISLKFCFDIYSYLRWQHLQISAGYWSKRNWSLIKTHDHRLCCNSNFPSRLASSRISGFEVVAARLPYPILLNKFLGNVVDSRSINWRCSSLLLAINAFAVALATTVFTTSLFFPEF